MKSLTKSNKPCPCGSSKIYQYCCARFIDLQQLPETPEQLMRSRYTAYTQSNISYIQQTMRGKPSTNFNADAAKDWSRRVKWLGLRIKKISTVTVGTGNVEQIGFVEFVASYRDGKKPIKIHENSEFHRYAGKWYYVDGIHKNIS